MNYATLLQEKPKADPSPSAIENTSNRVYEHAAGLRDLRLRLTKIREHLMGTRAEPEVRQTPPIPGPGDGLLGKLNCNVALSEIALSEVFEEVAYLEGL